MKHFIAIVFLLGFVGFADAQVKYSSKDLAAIKSYRAKEKVALTKFDRKAQYNIGYFFEGIYKKYKDTSITAAIRNYQRSSYAEGPLQHKESLKAAKRLADIYSHGIGTKANQDLALIYYYISYDEGRDSLNALKKRMSGSDKIISGDENSDSIVISFHPLLPIESATSKKLFSALEKRFQNDPELLLRMEAELPQDQTSAIYHYYFRQDLPQILFNNIWMLMESLSQDRLIRRLEEYPETGIGTRGKLTLIVGKFNDQ